jgi:hypothetical protein
VDDCRLAREGNRTPDGRHARAEVLRWAKRTIDRVDTGDWQAMALELPLPMWDRLWHGHGQFMVGDALTFRQRNEKTAAASAAA